MSEFCDLVSTGEASLKLEQISGFDSGFWVSKVIHITAIDTTSLYLLGHGCAPSSRHCLADSRREGDFKRI